MAKSEIRGGQIKDETIDSADLASGSVKAGELNPQTISGQGTITTTDTTNDRLLIWDATDSSLKQVSIGNLGVTADAAGSDGQVQYNNGGSAMGGAGGLYWDDTNSRLGVGAPSPSNLFTIESTNAFMATARNTDTNAGGAVITVENSRGGGNGVADDYCGAIRFDANDSGGATTQYAKISGMVHSPADGSEVGRLIFETTSPLADKGTPLYLRGNAVHILSGGADHDIDEANGADVAFYVSGTMDSAGTAVRGTSLFGGDLVVSGNVRASGNLYVADSAGMYTDKIRRFSDSDNTTKILLNDELIKLYGGHSTKNIVAIGEVHAADVNFLVSGSIGSRWEGPGTAVSTRGTAVFDGDLLSSGTFYALSGMTIDTSNELHVLNIDPVLDTVSFFKEGVPGADTNWFVSGSIGGTINHSCFGGDLIVSGGLAVDGITLVIDEAKSVVGIGTDSPRLKLDVHHDPTSLSDDTGGGEVITFGAEDVTDTLAAGKLMFLDSNGVWKYTDANAPAAAGGVLLAIALGTAVADGLLIRGFFDAATIQGSFIKGGVCYISEVAGTIDFTAPSGVGDTIRIVGYGTDTANVIYFNPSSTWIEL